MALSKFSAEETSESIMAEINITPLTDIFLVLLIIFMITTSAMVESAAKVNLPKATQTQQESRGLTISVTADNRIFVNQMSVDRGQLEATLRDLLADDQKKLVILQGDQAVLLGEAVRVMDIAKRAGAQAISIAAQKEIAPAAPAP
ncbi:MAG: ExbD/TolR family protein [Candidatus Binatia bacterium]